MICEEALVGDMEGEDEAEAPPRSPEEIFRTSLCCSLTPRGLKRVLTVLGVSGVVKGVGNPPEERSPPFSDNWGLHNGALSCEFVQYKFSALKIKITKFARVG